MKQDFNLVANAFYAATSVTDPAARHSWSRIQELKSQGMQVLMIREELMSVSF